MFADFVMLEHMEKSEAELAEVLAAAANSVVTGGRYQHYKGGMYTVLYVALDEPTLAPCVIYKAQYGEGLTFIRTLTDWLTDVEYQGKRTPRFQLQK